MIKIEVRLFGVLRKYTELPSISIDIADPTDVERIKSLIADQLQKMRPELEDYKVVAYSVLASEKEILRNSDAISNSCTLAILPPVSGG